LAAMKRPGIAELGARWHEEAAAVYTTGSEQAVESRKMPKSRRLFAEEVGGTLGSCAEAVAVYDTLHVFFKR